jgi:hypothetical protein
LEGKALERVEMIRGVRALVAGGASLKRACAALDVPMANYYRWSERYDEMGIEGCRDLPVQGGPPMVRVSDEEAAALRAKFLATNRGRDAGSMTTAAYLCAHDPASPLRQEVRAAILKDRANKNYLPVEVRRAFAGMGNAHLCARGGAKALTGQVHLSGHLRMIEENGAWRRLRGGEREVWDDLSINLGVWVPGPDSTPMLGRFQLLLGIDCASDFVVGWSYVVRLRDSYNQEDVVRTLHQVWKARGHVPREVVLEGGPWQSQRALAFVAEAGARVVNAKGRPWQKLVEGFFNRFHTIQSVELPKGNLGRFRGEMARETAEWTACRAGSRDPQTCFHSLPELLNGIDKVVAILNARRMDSRTYADRWVPAERYESGISEVGKSALPAGLWRHALPVRVRRSVQRGTVKVSAANALGLPAEYHFGCAEVADFNGAEVVVSFDPYHEPMTAVVELAKSFDGYREGKVIAEAAPCLSMRRKVARGAEGWQVDWESGLDEGVAARRAVPRRIAESVRAIEGAVSTPVLAPEVVTGGQEFRSSGVQDFGQGTPDTEHGHTGREACATLSRHNFDDELSTLALVGSA